MTVRPFILPLALLAAACPVPSTAAPRAVAVGFADLDLSRPAGVAALDKRLARAADAVCGRADHRDLRAIGKVRACRSDALEAASAKAATIVAARSGPTYASLGGRAAD